MPFDNIDWNAARNQVAKEDLYYPHPLIQVHSPAPARTHTQTHTLHTFTHTLHTHYTHSYTHYTHSHTHTHTHTYTHSHTHAHTLHTFTHTHTHTQATIVPLPALVAALVARWGALSPATGSNHMCACMVPLRAEAEVCLRLCAGGSYAFTGSIMRACLLHGVARAPVISTQSARCSNRGLSLATEPPRACMQMQIGSLTSYVRCGVPVRPAWHVLLQDLLWWTLHKAQCACCCRTWCGGRCTKGDVPAAAGCAVVDAVQGREPAAGVLAT